MIARHIFILNLITFAIFADDFTYQTLSAPPTSPSVKSIEYQLITPQINKHDSINQLNYPMLIVLSDDKKPDIDRYSEALEESGWLVVLPLFDCTQSGYEHKLECILTHLDETHHIVPDLKFVTGHGRAAIKASRIPALLKGFTGLILQGNSFGTDFESDQVNYPEKMLVYGLFGRLTLAKADISSIRLKTQLGWQADLLISSRRNSLPAPNEDIQAAFDWIYDQLFTETAGDRSPEARCWYLHQLARQIAKAKMDDAERYRLESRYLMIEESLPESIRQWVPELEVTDEKLRELSKTPSAQRYLKCHAHYQNELRPALHHYRKLLSRGNGVAGNEKVWSPEEIIAFQNLLSEAALLSAHYPQTYPGINAAKLLQTLKWEYGKGVADFLPTLYAEIKKYYKEDHPKKLRRTGTLFLALAEADSKTAKKVREMLTHYWERAEAKVNELLASDDLTAQIDFCRIWADAPFTQPLLDLLEPTALAEFTALKEETTYAVDFIPFARKWQKLPFTQEFMDRLNRYGQQKWLDITYAGTINFDRTVHFLKQWDGLEAAEPAQALYDQFAAKELTLISEIYRSDRQAFKLRNYPNHWPRTCHLDEAKRRYEEQTKNYFDEVIKTTDKARRCRKLKRLLRYHPHAYVSQEAESLIRQLEK